MYYTNPNFWQLVQSYNIVKTVSLAGFSYCFQVSLATSKQKASTELRTIVIYSGFQISFILSDCSIAFSLFTIIRNAAGGGNDIEIWNSISTLLSCWLCHCASLKYREPAIQKPVFPSQISEQFTIWPPTLRIESNLWGVKPG